MINRYDIIRSKPGYSIKTTHVVLVVVWAVSAAQALMEQIISSRALQGRLDTQVAGLVLRNILVLVFAMPLPIVVVLMVVIFWRANKLLNRFAEDEKARVTPAFQQMKSDLRLLYAFGIVYIPGYGLNFVVSINTLINLCGYVNILPYWESNEAFCEYKFASDALANILINFSNSVIVVQSRHVQVALKKMYRVTSRVVRNVSGGDVTENLIEGEETSQEP